MTNPTFDFGEIIKKVEKLKASGTVDLSTEEDLSIAAMNLVSLEEHLFFTNVKTGKEEYLGLLTQIRELRKSVMERMVPKHEGETWCITKHLLAATMRLMEVGTKLNADGKKEEAKELFKKAHETYSMFWVLRLKLINAGEFKEIAGAEKAWTYKDIVNKLVNCCDE
ncbi:MAG: hypothetical protein FJY98_01865 [Candidatus Liptonbacteria bacterium]|nr:hypothetical protein [Candidatus Liptonbacteria bacterium]